MAPVEAKFENEHELEIADTKSSSMLSSSSLRFSFSSTFPPSSDYPEDGALTSRSFHGHSPDQWWWCGEEKAVPHREILYDALRVYLGLVSFACLRAVYAMNRFEDQS